MTSTMWDTSTVAVVTGANKGIGYQICKKLGSYGLTVVVTSRDEQRGQAAVASLLAEVPDGTFVYQQLDTTNKESIAAYAKAVKEKFGSVSILINNAGMLFPKDTVGADEAQQIFACNVGGTRMVCEATLPFLGRNARIVNICSEAGHLGNLKSEDLKQRFINAKSATDAEDIGAEYAQAIRDGDYAEKGFSDFMYGMSKLGEISYTFYLARTLKAQGVMVNAVCPGWCQTDMTSHSGPGTPESGSDTPVWIAMRHPTEESFETEKFFHDRTAIAW